MQLTKATDNEWDQDRDPPYNLGDLVRYPDVAQRRRPFLRQKFPGSIGVEYVERTTESRDWEVLFEIVRRRAVPPSTPSIAVHLRLGDVIDHSRYTVADHLAAQRLYKNGVAYVRPRAYFVDVIQRLESKVGRRTQTVTIFTGFHHKYHKDHRKSYEYLDAIALLFEVKGYEVKLEIDGDPDILLRMTHADIFIPSAGGFGDLICNLRTKFHRDGTFCVTTGKAGLSSR